LGDLSPADIVEDDRHQDVSFLIGETGQDEQKIRFFATAHQHQKQVNVRAEIFYGLFRESISTDLQTLLSDTEDALTKALQAAISANIVSALSDDEVHCVASQLHNLGIQLTVKGPDRPAPLGEVLSTVTDKPEVFMDTFAKHDGPIEAFWTGLDAKPEYRGKVPDLQFSVQLGITTLSHAPLVKELQSQQRSGTISSLSDLAKFNVKNWTDIVQKPGIGAPEVIPGDTPTKKAQNYATGMSRLIEEAFPTKFIANRLLDQDDDQNHGHLSGKADLSTFFSKNPDFSFTTTRIPSLLISKPTAFDGVKDLEGLKANLSAMQRVYRVAPQYAQMRTLVSSGIASSMQIARMGLIAFTAKFSISLGGPGEASKIYERASQAHAVSYHLLANFGPLLSLSLDGLILVSRTGPLCSVRWICARAQSVARQTDRQHISSTFFIFSKNGYLWIRLQETVLVR
jgi:hypothetical protein